MGVRRVETHNHHHELILEPEVPPQAILRQLVERDVIIERFEVATPPLEEIFINVVEGAR